MMDTEEKKRLILESPLFEGITQEELVDIFRVVKKRIVPPNTIIFRQGDLGDSFYIIYSGKARVFRKSRNNERTELDILGPGDSIGEMSLLTGERRSAYFETIEETQLLVLTKAQFDHVLARYPNVTKAFFKKMTDKLVIERMAHPSSKLRVKPWLGYTVIAAVSLLCSLIFNQVNPNGITLFPISESDEQISIVSPLEAMTKYNAGKAIFIDARPTFLFDQAHIEGALNIPLNIFDIMYMMKLSEVEKKKTLSYMAEQ